jgi:hypothetical protein
MKYYAGIGSRSTPEDVLINMITVSQELSNNGYTLRSGGADGADKAFECGCDYVSGSKEIYLPWKNFNNNKSELYNLCSESFDVAKKYHPGYKYLKRAATKFMARNGYQVLGGDLKTPVDFIVCYTPKGKGEGGTGQAIRIAKDYNIPVYDYGEMSHDEIMKLIC